MNEHQGRTGKEQRTDSPSSPQPREALSALDVTPLQLLT